MKRLITIAAAAATLTLGLGATAASASIVGDPGVYLTHTPTLTIAAPNVVTPGKWLRLKTCLNDGNCATAANLKRTEKFTFILTGATGYEIQLTGTGWCITSRNGVAPAAVFFEACNDYASQNWLGDAGVVSTPSTPGIGIANVKTGLRLNHTLAAAYFPVVAGTQFTSWTNSS
jgi:hypothetical protein